MDDIFDFLDENDDNNQGQNMNTQEEDIPVSTPAPSNSTETVTTPQPTTTSAKIDSPKKESKGPKLKLQKNLRPISLIDFIEKNFVVFCSLAANTSLNELQGYKDIASIIRTIIDKFNLDDKKEQEKPIKEEDNKSEIEKQDLSGLQDLSPFNISRICEE